MGSWVNKSKLSWIPFALAVLFTIVTLLPANGWAFSTILTRGDLGGNDFVDWAGFGPEYTVVSNHFTTSSNGGLAITGSIPIGNFERDDQSFLWSGNFAPGDALIFTNFNSGPFSLSFANPIFGVGAQIMQDAFGAFTGTLRLFDSSNVELVALGVSGNSTSAGDNSAIFVGLLDTTASISRIEFNVNSEDAKDFAINRLDIVTSANQVPEPSALLLLGSGLAMLGIWRRKQVA